MHSTLRRVVISLAVICLATFIAACQQTSAEDLATQALAKQFVEAVFLEKDTTLAMSYVGPDQSYGHVNAKFVQDTIDDLNIEGCVTDPESVLVGKPGGDVTVPPISAAESGQGITARVAWTVASNYVCAKDATPFYRYSVIWLDQVNGQWGVSRASLYFGNPQGY